MFRSIRWRLVFSYVLLIALTLGVVGVVILQLVEDYVERQEREHLTANAQAVARQAGSLMWPVLYRSELQELAETSSFLGNAHITILDADNQVLADSETGTGQDRSLWLLPREWWLETAREIWPSVMVQFSSGEQLPVPFFWDWEPLDFEKLSPDTPFTLVRHWDGGWGSGFRLDVIQDPEQLQELAVSEKRAPRSDQVITIPIGQAEAPLGYVKVSGGPDFVTGALSTTRRAFGLAAVGAMLLAAAVGLVVSQGLASPIRQLTEVAGKMSSGDLATRAPVHGKDEIGQLAGQFNRMAGRLEASFAELAAERDALRRFIADASHELRTPITALRNFNDLLQGAAAEDPTARAEFLTESQIQLERLERITRNLLDLSRLDAGLVALDATDCDVGELIRAVACLFKPLAREKKIVLEIALPSPSVQVCCDRARIEMALSNLLDNALKFAPPGGRVVIGAEENSETVRLWVKDDGPGIDLADMPHIFERFYRGRNIRGEGSGLGLAIVQSVAQAHGGRALVESELGQGSFFTIELPI